MNDYWVSGSLNYFDSLTIPDEGELGALQLAHFPQSVQPSPVLNLASGFSKQGRFGCRFQCLLEVHWLLPPRNTRASALTFFSCSPVPQLQYHRTIKCEKNRVL